MPAEASGQLMLRCPNCGQEVARAYSTGAGPDGCSYRLEGCHFCSNACCRQFWAGDPELPMCEDCDRE